MTRTTLTLCLILLVILLTACAGLELTPTPAPVVVLPTATIAALPTMPPTTIPSPTLTPTLVSESRWQCDPSGGLACFNDLYYITMLSAEEGWAVSVPLYDHQLVLHYITLHYAPWGVHPLLGTSAFRNIRSFQRIFNAL